MPKKSIAFTYADWPHFFECEQYRRHILNRTNSPFTGKKVRTRIQTHYEAVTKHCGWMMSQQVPNWRTYNIFFPKPLRYGDSYKGAVVVVESPQDLSWRAIKK